MRNSHSFIIGLILIVSCINSKAQISQGGIPHGYRIVDESLLSQIEYLKIPQVDLKSLRAEDIYNDQIKDQPWRFGHDIYVDYNPDNSGVWNELEDGGRIWRMGITSKGALSINLTFNKYKLPSAAKLFIYSADKSETLGAFTDFNNQEDGYFATTLIPGESVVIEYYEPENVEFPGELNLWRITHGYRGFEEFYKSFGASDACHVNAVCSEGDPIRDQIRSVAVLIFGGFACTGALINNTGSDGTPLFLTANHCYDNASTAVFWFNWQSKTCTNPSGSPAYNSMSGATHRARYETSDFWLMELYQIPPENYNVYYSGWNRTTAENITGTVFCAHHPQADIKKISWSTGGVEATAVGSGPGSGSDHWRIAKWSDGTTTEQGSSGSPLFDPDGRIIGQLHGGYASCDSLLPDWYGNLGYSWIGGGADSSRLSNWLDPLGTEATVINGYDPAIKPPVIDGAIAGISEPENRYYDTLEITPTITIQNLGSTILSQAIVSYILDNEYTIKLSWSGDLSKNEIGVFSFPAIKTGFGKHTITAKIEVIDDENPENDSLNMFFTIINCDSIFLPIEEGFNQEIVPGCFTVEEVSGSSPEISFVNSGLNPTCMPSEGTHMVKFNSYDCITGSEIRLSTPKFATVNHIGLSLSFDWYQNYGKIAALDKMMVQYSYNKISWFTIDTVIRPNNLDTGWISKNYPFTDEMKDKDTIFVGFLFHSEYGENCYLDKLVINGIDTTIPFIDFYASPLVTDIDSIVRFIDSSKYGTFSNWEWDFGEGAVPETATGQGPHNVYYILPGYKTISLLVDGNNKKTKEDYIRIRGDFPVPQGLTGSVTDEKDVYLTWNQYVFEDGFESGDFSMWQKNIDGDGIPGDNGKPYWHVQDDSLQYIYEGDYSAVAYWGNNIDTWIISRQILVTTETQLSFFWKSSYYWHVDPNDNGDLFVKISFDGGTTWEEPIWTFGDIDLWESWTWYQTDIDLSEYTDSIITIAFNIVADNNADIALDDVSVRNSEKKKSNGTYPKSISSVYDLHNKSERNFSDTKIPNKKSDKSDLINFSIYRNAAKIGETTENTYLDKSIPIGTYTYYVVANYDNPPGISKPSNEVEVEIIISGTDPVYIASEIMLFPNPSSGIINTVFEKDYELSLFNMQGAVLWKTIVNKNTKSIDLSDYPKGLYILRFNDNSSIISKKIMIK